MYSPIAFGKKTDPEGLYIKKYVPELKNYPSGIIYEPWKASADNQKKYGCIIGKDYPHRIVDHDVVMKKNLAKMKAAYAAKGKVKTEVTSTSLKREIKDSPEAGPSKKAATQKNKIENYFKKEEN